MSPLLVAVFAGIGVGGWAYTQLAHRTGNSNPQSVVVSALAFGFFAAVVVFTLFKFVFNW